MKTEQRYYSVKYTANFRESVDNGSRNRMTSGVKNTVKTETVITAWCRTEGCTNPMQPRRVRATIDQRRTSYADVEADWIFQCWTAWFNTKGKMCKRAVHPKYFQTSSAINVYFPRNKERCTHEPSCRTIADIQKGNKQDMTVCFDNAEASVEETIQCCNNASTMIDTTSVKHETNSNDISIKQEDLGNDIIVKQEHHHHAYTSVTTHVGINTIDIKGHVDSSTSIIKKDLNEMEL
ncbi:hypothetical protein BDR07DRAFT_1376173 [Suillus spraguei]|nr:hypothetical protein BDR07DRAFT_1377603 [Suillus spraguei]KAG2362884.1 hypothetical protein BDR07DRAFT_1376173 [Suillus spraguei]